MLGHMKTWSFGGEGKKYPDDGNGGISQLQNLKVVRIHGFKEVWGCGNSECHSWSGKGWVWGCQWSILCQIAERHWLHQLRCDCWCTAHQHLRSLEVKGIPYQWIWTLKSWSLTKWLKCIVASGKSCSRFFNPEADCDLLNRCPYTKGAKAKNWHFGCPFLFGRPTASSQATVSNNSARNSPQSPLCMANPSSTDLKAFNRSKDLHIMMT